MEYNLVITGVGGQGILSAANLIASAAKKSGHNVYVGEIHGMAQRGGSVISSVRIGDVHSSLVSEGEATVLLGMEIAESLRAKDYISSESWIVTNKRKIVPLNITRSGNKYPDINKIEEDLKSVTNKFISIDARKIAEKSGAVITENVVMLGLLASTSVLPIEKDVFLDVIDSEMKEQYIEVNKKAFKAGYDNGIENIN